jgi:argininosuccinate lyase
MSEPLWAKGLPLDAMVHRFTVGDDPAIDATLIPYDAAASAAHARMLGYVKLLAADDVRALVGVLHEIAERARSGDFEVSLEQEDCHTAIEHELIRQLGEAGKRIHLARSRNDQVIVAMRLYLREAVLELGARTAALAAIFLQFNENHAAMSMPGYTHLRRAMPSSFGQWAAAFAEGLLEELQALPAVYRRLDRCPLGAAAGFGVPLPIDREYTAKLLGFSCVQRSPIDVQNSRGRHELALMHWLDSLALVLEKFLWDVALYSTEEFGFIRLPDAFTTGSSIMPQKRNPDVIELARGRCREIRGFTGMIEQIATGLPSNYHRDTQLLKGPTFTAIRLAGQLLDLLAHLVPGLKIDAGRAQSACTGELYATHAACALAAEGVSFRDAYRQVAAQVIAGEFAPTADFKAQGGGSGDFDLALTAAELATEQEWLAKKRAAYDAALTEVWSV